MSFVGKAIRQFGLWLAGMPYYDQVEQALHQQKYRPVGDIAREGGQLYTVFKTIKPVTEFIEILKQYGLDKWIDTYQMQTSDTRRVYWNVHGNDEYERIKPLLLRFGHENCWIV